MTRTLYLHIGSHKTGTTSIQHFLLKETPRLAKRGYAYPVGSNKSNIGSILGGPADTAEEVMPGQRAKARIRKAIRKMLAPGQPVVIASYEGLSYANDRDTLQYFHEKLRAEFQTIKVITYLRRQDQLAVSHHQEGANPQRKLAALLHGHRPTALPETSALQQKYLDYNTRIGMWADVFGDENIVIRVFDRSLLKNGDAVADFLDLVGLGDLDATQAKSRNESMGFIKSKIGHILHQVVPVQSLRSAILSRMPNDSRLLPSREDALRFLEPYVEGNRELNRRFAISDRESLFSDDFSMYPEEGQELWTEETANSALRGCLDMIKELADSTFDYSIDDYTTAARAVEASNPDLAARFLASALALKPGSERLARRAGRYAAQAAEAENQDDEDDTLTAEESKPKRKGRKKAAQAGARKARRGGRKDVATPAEDAEPDVEPAAGARKGARRGKAGTTVPAQRRMRKRAAAAAEEASS